MCVDDMAAHRPDWDRALDIQQALTSLEEKHRKEVTAVRRYYFEFRRTLDIAAELGIAEASCRTYLHRIRKTIKQAFPQLREYLR